MSTQHSVAPGVLTDRVGDELMVVVPGNNEYIKLSGNVADVLLSIQAGHPVSSSDPALAQLEELGVITARGMSRRGLITAGAVGAGAGIAMLSMPVAAAASSVVAEELVGSLFGGEWDGLTADVAIKLNATLGDNWVAAVFIDEDAPYSASDVDNANPIKGRVEAGGRTYDAFLMDDGGGLIGWYFKGTLLVDAVDSRQSTGEPASDSEFVLTFTLGGQPYRVTQAA